MKKRFSSNDDLCHVYAQQKQHYGRGNSLFFYGEKIYSFGYHYTAACFHGDVVLINSYIYSNCTGKHLSAIRSAVSHKKTFTVPNVNNPRDAENIQHLANNVVDAYTSVFTARRGLEWSLENMLENVKVFNAYCKTFKIKDSIILPADFLKEARAVVAERTQHLKEVEAKRLNLTPEEQANVELKREKIRARKEALELEKIKDKVDAWRRGENNNTLYGATVALRIKDNMLETSRGARVPLVEAKRLFIKIINGAYTIGEKIGPYTLDAVTEDFIRCGCHNIPIAEAKSVLS